MHLCMIMDQHDECVDSKEKEGQGLIWYLIGVIYVYLEDEQDNDPHYVDEKHATHNVVAKLIETLLNVRT